MANIIINNYCNQTCSYCFAWKNMEDGALKKEMDLKTFIYCLKHLQTIKDNRVRILGWEPLLHKNIKKIFQLSVKGGFYMTIFSNLKIPLKKWHDILDLWDSYDYSRLKFNLNLNDEDFYKQAELDLIYDSLAFLKKKGCDIIVSYNIYEYSNNYDYIFDTAKRFDVRNVVLKVTNTVIGDKEIIDTNSREYWEYIYKILGEYYKDFTISFGCWLSSKIFTKSEVRYIEDTMKVTLGWGCENNGGRYDINTDGTIYRCYPLQSLYNTKNLHITSPIFQKNTIRGVYDFIEGFVPREEGLVDDENCLGNQMNKLIIK